MEQEIIRQYLDGASISQLLILHPELSRYKINNHEDEVKDFQNIINFLIDKKKNNKTIFTSAWHINWRGRKQVLSILDILYANCPRHLQRKYEKYIILKNSLN